MRCTLRMVISMRAGTVLLALLGVGIWRMVEVNTRGEQRGARDETIGSTDKAAITADQARAAALAAHPDAAAVRTALAQAVVDDQAFVHDPHSIVSRSNDDVGQGCEHRGPYMLGYVSHPGGWGDEQYSDRHPARFSSGPHDPGCGGLLV